MVAMFCNLVSYLYILISLSYLINSVISKSTSDKIHWVLIHYHKTGHELCNYFGSYVFQYSNCKRVKVSNIKPFWTQDAGKLLNSDVSILKPHGFEWQKVFNVAGHSFRVVHFVREPFDMVMSGYLYHSEIPAPEGWLNNENFDPCFVEEKKEVDIIRNKYLPAIQKYTQNKVNITKMYDDILKLCRQLSSKNNKYSFNNQLHIASNASVFEGVRLEAVRALILGDHLSMAYNTLQESSAKQSKNINVRRTFTAEFPVQDVAFYRRSTVSLYDFLMPVVRDEVFYKCFENKEEAVESAIKSAFHDLPQMLSNDSSKKDKPKADAHITGGSMPKEDRQKYIKRLEEDPVLGPFLLIIREILNNENMKVYIGEVI